MFSRLITVHSIAPIADEHSQKCIIELTAFLIVQLHVSDFRSDNRSDNLSDNRSENLRDFLRASLSLGLWQRFSQRFHDLLKHVMSLFY